MDQDTDLVPIIISLIKFLHLDPHSAMDTESTTGNPNPADLIANAIHASYHRGYQDAQRQLNSNRQTETRLASDTGYTNGFAACIQEAEARFSAVRDSIVYEGYQQGLIVGEHRTRLILELALADFMGRADAAAFERGRSSGAENNANIRASAFADGQAVGEATARQAAQQEADRLRLQAEHRHQQEVRDLNTTITSLQNVVDHAAENERRLQARLDATAAEEDTRAGEQRLQLLSEVDGYRHGLETAQRALAERLDELENLREIHRTSLQRERSLQATIEVNDRQIAERMEQQRYQEGAFQRLAFENLELAGEVAEANRTIATLNQEVVRLEARQGEQAMTINNLGAQLQGAHRAAADATAARNDALADAAAADALTDIAETRATAAENRVNDLEQRLANATTERDRANAQAADAEQRVDRLQRELQAQNRDPEAYHEVDFNSRTIPLQERRQAEYEDIAPDAEMTSNDENDYDYGHGYNESEDGHSDDEEPDTETDEPSAIRIDDDAGQDDMDAQSETPNDEEAAAGHDDRHSKDWTEGYNFGLKEGHEAGMKKAHDEYNNPDAEKDRQATIKLAALRSAADERRDNIAQSLRRDVLGSELEDEELDVLLNNASLHLNKETVIRRLQLRPYDVLNHLDVLTRDDIWALCRRPELSRLEGYKERLEDVILAIGPERIDKALRDLPVRRSGRVEPSQGQGSATQRRANTSDNLLVSLLRNATVSGDQIDSLSDAMNNANLGDTDPANTRPRKSAERPKRSGTARDPSPAGGEQTIPEPLQDITAQNNSQDLAIGPSSRQGVISRSTRRGAKAPYSLGQSG